IAKGPFHYEDGVKVPFIVRWPGGGVPAGAVSESLQSLVDLSPTFLSAAGIETPGNMMQGVDLLPSWRDPGHAARDHALIENRHNPTTVHLRTFITERHKLTAYRGHDYGELFDLQADPHERHNLWDEP